MITKKEPKKVKNVPIIKLRMMSDDEWNKLAYRNYLERGKADR